MIELLKQQLSRETSAEGKVNLLRESLQLTCLKIMHDSGYFSNLAFVGGTALRILYDVRRFSEDLDFSLIEKKGYDFPEIVRVLIREFKLRGLDAEGSPKIIRTVHGSMIKFPGLLKSVGISALESQKLSIKIEIDSNPPRGWDIENTVINKMYLFNITHYNVPSLYASKLHACLFRKYVKGRDYYDLIWYLGKKIEPNYVLLNNAVKQTLGKDLGLDKTNLKNIVLKKLDEIDFGLVKKDVERFLEDKAELKLLEKPIIAKGVQDIFK